MTKDNLDNQQTYVPLGRRRAQEERLEISSTGYGLESVSKEAIEDDPVTDPPSCGGV